MTPGWVLKGVLLCVAGLIVPTGYAQDSTNSWTKPTSGLWEEPFWSSGGLPSPGQNLILVTNFGSKTLEIGASTTANFSNSLSLNRLTIEGPAETINELFLNRAGTNVPLDVEYLTIGTNAPVVSLSSALTGYEAYISSPLLLAENSWLKIMRILLWSDLTLSNSYASIGLLRVFPQRNVSQFQGSSAVNLLSLDGGSRFLLEGGTLSLRNLYLVNSSIYQGVTTNGTATFVQNGGETSFDSILFGMRPSQSGGTYWGEFQSTAGSLRAGRLTFFNGRFSQTGGTNIIDVMVVPERVYNARGSYGLSGGTLVSSNLSIGSWYDPLSNPNTPNPGSFGQGGGIHTNGSMTLNGGFRYWRRFGTVGVIRYGTYHQSGGLLISSNVYVNGGSFEQSGGTNFTDTLTIHESGSFVLAGGELTTSNVVVDSQYCVRDAVSQRCFNTPFSHQEGTHVIQGSLELKQIASYSLDNGGLTARNIFIGKTSSLNCKNGGVTNSGTFTLQGGAFEAGNGNHQLGQLELLEFGYPSYDGPEHPGSLGLSGSEGGVVRFRESRDVQWSAPQLKITGWHGWDRKGTRLFIGTDASGLTEEQLSKVVFVNPLGWGKGEYPARILNTGEIVPAVAPPLTIARDPPGLILSWPGEYDLFRATNIAGPFLKVDNATKSATNLFNAPQQYFQLRSREP